jgi:peptide chain release factor 2
MPNWDFKRRREKLFRLWNNAKEAEFIGKKILETKKWIEDYNKAVEMTDELQLAYDF